MNDERRTNERLAAALRVDYDDEADLVCLRTGDPALVERAIRVLVVEDNPHIAELLKHGLASEERR